MRYGALTRLAPNALIAGLCIGFVLALLVVSGFFGEPPRNAFPSRPRVEALSHMSFTLGATTYAIDVPEAAEIRDLGDPSAVTIYDFTRGQRLQRQIRIAMAPRERGAYHDRTIALAGGRLDYQVTDNIGGGSGGPIGELTGRMEIGPRVLFIECTDQDGLGYTHPDWCLPYLDRLKIVSRDP